MRGDTAIEFRLIYLVLIITNNSYVILPHKKYPFFPKQWTGV